jgi:acyl-CoA thioesterase FadM
MFRRGQADAPLVAVDLVYVYVDTATRASRRVDDALRARIRAFEKVAPDEPGAGAN